jgi:hypothetical protein
MTSQCPNVTPHPGECKFPAEVHEAIFFLPFKRAVQHLAETFKLQVVKPFQDFRILLAGASNSFLQLPLLRRRKVGCGNRSEMLWFEHDYIPIVLRIHHSLHGIL